MCDLPTIVALLGSAAGLITASLVALGVAIALNNGFFSAPGSPAAMAVAGGLLVAAVAVLSPASALINDYVSCMNAGAACAGQLSNVQNALAGLITVLGIQAVASFAAAGIAWIPWAGQAPMWVILGSLVVQLALIPSIIVFFNDLVRCAEAAAASPPAGSSSGPLIAATTVIYLIAVIYFVHSSMKKPSKKKPSKGRR
jgi:hypothetical protein